MTDIDTADKSWAMHVLHGAEYAALRRELQRETTHTFKERFLIILHKWLYSLRQIQVKKEDDGTLDKGGHMARRKGG